MTFSPSSYGRTPGSRPNTDRRPLREKVIRATLDNLWAGDDEDDEESPFPGFKKVAENSIEYTPYAHYQQNPIGFIREELRETLTPDAEDLVQTVWSSRNTIAKAGNAVGKTHAAARVAVTFLSVFPRSQVYLAAAPPESNLKMLLWGEISDVARANPSVFKGMRVPTGMKITRKNNDRSYITGLAIPQASESYKLKARFSGKHAPHLLFIVDEGDAVPNEVYEAIESCMSGGFARLLVMFNPRQEAGPVFMMERDRTARVVRLSAFTHPNVLTGQDIIPGAVTREVTVRHINQWTRALAPKEQPDSECFEVPEFLVGEQAESLAGDMYPPLLPGFRKVMEPSFYYMVLGEYPAVAEAQLISRAWIDLAEARWLSYVSTYGEIPPPSVRPIGGLDVAEFGPDWNVFFRRYGGFVPRPDKWRGVDPDVTATDAAQLDINANCQYTNVDGTGVGSSVAPRMMRGYKCKAYSIKVQSSAPDPDEKDEIVQQYGDFYSIRDYMLWQLREWLRTDKGAMLPPVKELREELMVPTYGKEKRTGRLKVTDSETIKEKVGRSPDHMMALGLTFAPANDNVATFSSQNYVR